MKSFYIPLMSVVYNQDYVSCVFQRLQIGKVDRVDFLPYDNMRQRAFVHMEYLYDTEQAKQVSHTVFDLNLSCRVRPNIIKPDTDYWILLKNKKPITHTRLNIHQIAGNQERNTADQKVEMDRMQETIYQILGHLQANTGLSSKSTYELFNYMKYGKHYDHGWLYGKDGTPDSKKV